MHIFTRATLMHTDSELSSLCLHNQTIFNVTHEQEKVNLGQYQVPVMASDIWNS